MNNLKHTPGPWAIDTDDDVYATTPPDDGGDIICEAPDAYEESMVRWPANAKLIAAAPDMLEALMVIENSIVTTGTFKDSSMHKQINAAIAKATSTPNPPDHATP